MTPDISGFIPVSLVETDIYIKVADMRFIAAKQTGQSKIGMRDNDGKSFICVLYNVLLGPYLCNRLFSIITLMNLGHT